MKKALVSNKTSMVLEGLKSIYNVLSFNTPTVVFVPIKIYNRGTKATKGGV